MARTSATRNGRLAAVAIALLMGCAVPATAQDSADIPAILGDDDVSAETYLPDFSYAGYDFGNSPVPDAAGTVFDVTDYGAKPDDEIDDSKAVLDAIAAAGKEGGPVIVRFPAGRFIITEILRIHRSDFVLQGSGRGEGGTVLFFPRPLRMVGDGGSLDYLREYLVDLDKRQVEPERNLDVYFSEYSWSGGFIWIETPAASSSEKVQQTLTEAVRGARGERTLEVADAGNLKAGDWIDLVWHNRQGPDAPLLKEIYGETGTKFAGKAIGSHHWEFPDRPLVSQLTRIEAVDGNTVTLSDPLLHSAGGDVPAEIASWRPLTNVGLESFRIEFPDAPNYGHHTEEGWNGVYLTGAANSWIRDLTIANADSGILTYTSSAVTIADIRTEGTRTAHYAVHMGSVHNVLATRIEVRNPVLHTFSVNTQATRSVYKDSVAFVSPMFDQHSGANHQNLFDNITVYIRAKDKKGRLTYPLWDGSGAGYWQPGHGRFNTTWNVQVIVENGRPGDTVLLTGLQEGPSARIVGIHGNREFEVDYRPQPYVEAINEDMIAVPSLYDHQLAKRKAAGEGR